MRTNIRTFESNLGLLDIGVILSGGATVLTQIFPNIFGGNRRRLTDGDWNTLIPTNGYWHNKLKEYLKSRIHYDVDAVNNIVPFTGVFAYENGFPNVQEFQKVLEAEKQGKVVQPGNFDYSNPILGGSGGISTTTILLIVGAFVLISTLKKK